MRTYEPRSKDCAFNRQFNSRLFPDVLAVTYQYEEFNCVLLKSLTCNGKQHWGHHDSLIDIYIFKFSILIPGESKSFWTNDGSKLRGFHSSRSTMQGKWLINTNSARNVRGIKLKAPNMYFENTRILTFTNKTDVCWVCFSVVVFLYIMMYLTNKLNCPVEMLSCWFFFCLLLLINFCDSMTIYLKALTICRISFALNSHSFAAFLGNSERRTENLSS